MKVDYHCQICHRLLPERPEGAEFVAGPVICRECLQAVIRQHRVRIASIFKMMRAEVSKPLTVYTCGNLSELNGELADSMECMKSAILKYTRMAY